jgi:phosphoribosyl-ATP pyrophosphohydrolase/phosphoribosyl-AMP cyclohydrolase
MTINLTQQEIESFIQKINFDKLFGLVPAVIQDEETLEVLMVGFMSKQAVKMTLETGKTHFWSRTRQRLWMKGEESGNISEVTSIIIDCDNDTLLIKVSQTGPVCHTGNRSCFYQESLLPAKNQPTTTQFLNQLTEIIQERDINRPENSYVSSLFNKGTNAILQKVGEEATEVIIAAKEGEKREIIHETADVLFHLLVLLRDQNISFTEILEELSQRHQKKSQKISIKART